MRMLGRVILILIVVAALILAIQHYAPEKLSAFSRPSSVAGIVDSARPSVVSIWSDRGGEPYNQGSGFIVSEDGLLLTNMHVIDMGDEYSVGFDRGVSDVRVGAEVIATNAEYDVALLRLVGNEWAALPLRPGKVRQGDRVLAMGFPESQDSDFSEMTVTSGIASRISPDDDGGPLIIQTDAYITYGSSGGPLYDIDAHGVVGICTWSQHDEKDEPVPGINYAMSIDKAMELFAEYLEQGKDGQTDARGPQ